MSKQKTASAGQYSGHLFQVGVYKGRQGRVTRQTTWAAIAIVTALACYKLHLTLESWQKTESPALYYGLPLALLAGGLWFAYRLVNWSRFADFLIAVEAEMKKVSWPTWTEMVRSSIVVIFVIFALALVLWVYDFLWRGLFSMMGIV